MAAVHGKVTAFIGLTKQSLDGDREIKRRLIDRRNMITRLWWTASARQLLLQGYGCMSSVYISFQVLQHIAFRRMPASMLGFFVMVLSFFLDSRAIFDRDDWAWWHVCSEISLENQTVHIVYRVVVIDIILLNQILSVATSTDYNYTAWILCDRPRIPSTRWPPAESSWAEVDWRWRESFDEPSAWCWPGSSADGRALTMKTELKINRNK